MRKKTKTKDARKVRHAFEDTLAVMQEAQQRAAAMTAEERNGPLKKKPKGRENVDPDLG